MARDDGAGGPMPVYLEVGQKLVFACALDWPGWCRSGKSEDLALEALAGYAGRYAAVAVAAGVEFAVDTGAPFAVVERLAGTRGYTDFGAPGAVASRDAEPLAGEELERQIALLRAAWLVLDRIAAAAPAALRKGPRGGGRDRDGVLEHVLGAEARYARKIGARQRQPAVGDAPAIAALREGIVAALGAGAGDAEGWPARYAIRRVAWHVLDHAWEMEDRGVRAMDG